MDRYSFSTILIFYLLSQKSDPSFLFFRNEANKNTTTILRPLHRSTCISRPLQLSTGGFCWCGVFLPTCPCRRQPMHSDQEDTVVIHKSVIYTVSYLHVQRGHQKWNQKSATVECGVKSKNYQWLGGQQALILLTDSTQRLRLTRQ